MDFSKSLSFGENTFQEIDKCEAKVKVFDENQLLLKSNAADSDHENIAKSNQKFEQKSTVFVEKAGMQHRITENPLALEKSIISRPTDVPTLGKQHLGADNACYGKERPSKQSPATDPNSHIGQNHSKPLLGNDGSIRKSPLRTKVELNGALLRERSYETAKNSTVEKNSSKGSKLSTGKQNTPTSFHNNQSKPIQQMQGAHTTRQELTGRTSMTSLYAWGCTDLILEEYRKKGITQMFEWQAECLQSIAQNESRDCNVVYNAPTSAGKTFVSEILMIRNVLKRQKKVVIILPYISVVREKMYYLQDLLRSSAIRVEGFFGGYTPPGGFESIDVAVLTIEKANSIVNRLLEQKKIETIGLIVVDEIHLISDPGRGYILELLLAKALFYSWKFSCCIQIVAMTATLPNANLLTKWLNAKYYQTDFRPIPLREMIKIGTEIYDSKFNLLRSISTDNNHIYAGDQENVGQMCIETIVEGSAAIVFCPSKAQCEALAISLAGLIYKLGKNKCPLGEKLRSQINMQNIKDLKTHLKNSPAGLDSVLEKTISYGVAFHHAGLTFDERDIIENGFKSGFVRVIIATSTLSSGVNLPARRVIIRTPLFSGAQMCALTYRQMIGRAGRFGKDTIGESILICSGSNIETGKELISAQLKPIKSCLELDNYCHLKRAILEIIASGIARTENDLEHFFKCTLLYLDYKNGTMSLNGTHSTSLETRMDSADIQPGKSIPIKGSIQFLEKYEFIRMHLNENKQEKCFIATRLGYACLASSMAPSEGFHLFSELQRARRSFVLDSELHAVYLVTPLSVCYQLPDIDWFVYLKLWENLQKPMQRVGELVGIKEPFLMRAMRGQRSDEKSVKIYKRFYASLALQELIDEVPIHVVATKFKINRGILQCLQQSASLFAGVVASFCNALNWDLLGLLVSQFKDRLFFGAQQELLDLLKIPIVNSQRARALFKAGFHTLADLSNADLLSVEKSLYDSISFDTKKHDGESKYDEEQRNELRLVFITGKAGLTVPEAAKMIIQDARNYLQQEIGVPGVIWSHVTTKKEVSTRQEEVTINTGLLEKNRAKKKTSTVNPESKKIERVNAGLSIEMETHKRNIADFPIINRVVTNGLHRNSKIDEVNSHPPSRASSQNLININGTGHAPDQTPSPIKIIDVFQNVDFLRLFLEKFHVFAEGGLSLAINAIQTDNSKIYNCMLRDGTYLHGVSLCFGENMVFYLNLQETGPKGLNFTEKVSFLRKIMVREDFTLKIIEAREELKKILRCFPLFHVNCLLEDPKIAQWLFQSNFEPDFNKMVEEHTPDLAAIVRKIPGNTLKGRSIYRFSWGNSECAVREWHTGTAY